MASLRTERQDTRLTLTLDRPAVHNALDDSLIEAIRRALTQADDDTNVRYVVIAGEGPSFCAGADLNAMQRIVDAKPEESRAEAERLWGLMQQMVDHPKPIIGRVHGAALGGGMGLVSACDLVVAAPGASFGLPEVRLGLVPAMIFPFLARRVRRDALLCAALTGGRFDADAARELGLVNRVSDDLDAVIADWGDAIEQGAAGALATVKRLFSAVVAPAESAMRDYTIEMIIERRRSDEGQEGMRAFLERRRPSWRGGR